MTQHSVSIPARRIRSASDGIAIKPNMIIDGVLLTLFSLFILHIQWIGYMGADDAGYIEAAMEWVAGGPLVSDFFGDLRYPVILPVVLNIIIFGSNEISVYIPTLLYEIGAVLIMYTGMRALADRFTGLIAGVILASLPVMGNLFIVSDDACEIFFAASSFFLFVWGMQIRASKGVFFVAGAAAGFAMMTRESSVALLASYAIFYLLDDKTNRPRYWLMAAASAAVALGEMSFYYVMVGDPFHRIRAVAYGMQHPAPMDAVGVVDFGSHRVFNLSKVLDPFLVAGMHPQLGAIFIVGCGALLWTVLRPKAQGAALARKFSLWGTLSFCVAAYVLGHLALSPRYFLAAAFAMAAAVALWLRFGLLLKHTRVCVVVIAVLALADIGGIMITNKSPVFAERALAALAVSTKTVIHTDPETVFRGRFLYQWADVAKRISSEAPRPGDLYLFNPKFAAIRTPRNEGTELSDYQPQKSWVVLQKISEPSSILARMFSAIGIDRWLPVSLWGRIAMPNPSVTLYRLPS